MITAIYVFAAVLVSALITLQLTRFKLKLAFQDERTKLEKAHISLEEQLKACEADLNELKKEQMSSKQELQKSYESINQLSARKAALEQEILQITALQEKLDKKEQHIGGLNTEITALRNTKTELETLINEERKHGDEKLKLLEDSKNQLKLEFQELAHKILEDKSRKFTDANKENISALINPLQAQLKDFSKKIDDCYSQEAKERHTLQNEIKNLKDLNLKMSEEAVNLTNALKGDSKKQGIWGELKLESILEASGLTKGDEYTTQESLHDAEGKLLRPDIVVKLPEERAVIIDSKVSLVAYERFCSTSDESERQKAQAEHINSVKTHVKQLSQKAYQAVKELKSLDYVLLFMPVEGAFRLAFEGDKEILLDAHAKNIVIVTPSTLLSTLKLIKNLWQNEYQSRHTMEIVKKAETLYGKFVGFVENLDKVGKSIQDSQKAFDHAYGQLIAGKGNIVTTCKSIEALGVKAKKQIPAELVDKAMLSEEQAADLENGGLDLNLKKVV